VPGRREGAPAASGQEAPEAPRHVGRRDERSPHAAAPAHRDRRPHPAEPRQRPPAPATPEARGEEIPPRIADAQPVAEPLEASASVKPSLGETRFDAVGLPSRILGGIEELGFSRLTPLQEKLFAARAAKNHFIVQGGYAAGKTSAALILAFERLLALPPDAPRAVGMPRVLVLVPTRDLAVGTAAAAAAMGRHTSFRAVAIFGGGDAEAQRADLAGEPVDLLVSTPGRLLDFQERGAVKLDAVLLLVVDEADRLLGMGSLADVDHVVPLLPPPDRRATLVLASAPLPSLARAVGAWMDEVTTIQQAAADATAAQDVEQRAYAVSHREKLSLLYNLLKRPEFERVLVFVNDDMFAERVASVLAAQELPCATLSSAMPPDRRTAAIEAFRTGRTPVLVLTDAAAAGLESERVTHAINCDMPRAAEDYTYRLGFAGRGTARGAIVTFATENDAFAIPEIEAVTGHPLRCEVPTDELLARLPNAPDFGDRGPRRFGDRRGGPRDSGRRGDRRGGPRSGPRRR
jgi:ATP-dependent RNA helicase RhlB